MIGGLVLLFFLGWVFCRLFIWQPHEPLYRLLKALEDTAMFWGSGVVLLGVFLLTYRSISKPLDYLDEVIEAAEELAHPADTPIRLSPPLESIQDELNIVREGALRSAMYAKEAEQRKNDLIVYLAHDLKTPLTSVIGYLSLLRDEPQISPEMRAKYTGIALEKAERLEALINEFFEITRFNLIWHKGFANRIRKKQSGERAALFSHGKEQKTVDKYPQGVYYQNTPWGYLQGGTADGR